MFFMMLVEALSGVVYFVIGTFTVTPNKGKLIVKDRKCIIKYKSASR